MRIPREASANPPPASQSPAPTPNPAYASTSADLDGNKTVSRWLANEGTRPANITVSTPDPDRLTEHLQEIAGKHAPDLCFVDIAGVYETALTFAIGRADLTIIPVCPSSEADIFEARKVAKHIDAMSGTFNRHYPYRLLATKVSTLPSFAQRHGFKEIRRLQLPLFATTIAQRTAYEEVGYSGTPAPFRRAHPRHNGKGHRRAGPPEARARPVPRYRRNLRRFNRRPRGNRMSQTRPTFHPVADPPDIPDHELAKFSKKSRPPIAGPPGE